MAQPAKVGITPMPYDDAQEERLQNLEKSNTDTVGQLSGMDVRLSYIEKGIQDLGDRLVDKIDLMVSPIIARLDSIDTRADEHSKVIGDLSREAEAKKARWDSMKKLIMGVGIAIGGVAGKELFVWIYHFITRV